MPFTRKKAAFKKILSQGAAPPPLLNPPLVRIRLSVWLVSCYVGLHVFVLVSIVIVTLPHKYRVAQWSFLKIGTIGTPTCQAEIGVLSLSVPAVRRFCTGSEAFLRGFGSITPRKNFEIVYAQR